MSDNSTRLIINGGSENCQMPFFRGISYVYSLGVRTPSGDGIVSVNDTTRLHQIALEVRDDYSRWIYSLNQMFVERDLVYKGLSLFLISDCSCKRTEFFETYSVICNLLLIREIIQEKAPSQILLRNTDKRLLQGLQSVADGIPICVHEGKVRRSARLKRIASDLRFSAEIAAITLLKVFFVRQSVPEKQEQRRYFFTVYPKMMDSQGRDKKYGQFAGKEDLYAASIITDGFHQHVSVKRFFQLRKKALDHGLVIVDDYLEHRDWIRCVYWIYRLRRSVRGLSNNRSFRNIDVSAWVEDELSQSASRLARFMGIKGAFERFFDQGTIREFVYYLHEYPIGRLISWLLSVGHPQVVRSGFQHGPAAWRKLVYFTCPQEISLQPNFLLNIPMPNNVWAEDDHSAAIYRYAGYQNVRVMDRVYRLSYLEDIEPKKDVSLALIAPGLNDGEIMLNVLAELIAGDEKRTFLLKPHPIANNQYLEEIEAISNLVVTGEEINCLLKKVGEVFVTYSSVGLEAKTLGIPVTVVDIPGEISESPLLDSAGTVNTC